MGIQQKRMWDRLTGGGMVAQSAGVAESVPPCLHLPDVSSSPRALVSRLPQRRDRVPSRCGLSIPKARRVKTAQVEV
jgi:hypothetical protein